MKRCYGIGLGILLALAGGVVPGLAQEPAIGKAPTGPLTLEQCLQLGLERQSSLAAARASLAAAEAGRRALEHLFLAGVVSHDLPIRRRQADLGVLIAQAGLAQAEWETIYAITRNYFSAVYAHEQEVLTRELVNKLKLYREKAQFLVKKGDPNSVVTQVDVDRLSASIDLYELRHLEAVHGLERAKAALREAIGLEADTVLWLAPAELPPMMQVPSREELLTLAWGRRGELVQATCAAQVTQLEVCAQAAAHGLQVKTFAAVADIHSRPIPQGVANKEYRPSAIGLDMPVYLAGRREDRVTRARALCARAEAVVSKTRHLIALELDDSYLKWREAAQRLQTLQQTTAKALAVLKSMEARFEIGNVSGEEILRARTLATQVQAEVNEARYHQALALAALERITAGGFRISPTKASADAE